MRFIAGLSEKTQIFFSCVLFFCNIKTQIFEEDRITRTC